jgi:hypothetical protein
MDVGRWRNGIGNIAEKNATFEDCGIQSIIPSSAGSLVSRTEKKRGTGCVSLLRNALGTQSKSPRNDLCTDNSEESKSFTLKRGESHDSKLARHDIQDLERKYSTDCCETLLNEKFDSQAYHSRQ